MIPEPTTCLNVQTQHLNVELSFEIGESKLVHYVCELSGMYSSGKLYEKQTYEISKCVLTVCIQTLFYFPNAAIICFPHWRICTREIIIILPARNRHFNTVCLCVSGCVYLESMVGTYCVLMQRYIILM